MYGATPARNGMKSYCVVFTAVGQICVGANSEQEAIEIARNKTFKEICDDISSVDFDYAEEVDDI